MTISLRIFDVALIFTQLNDNRIVRYTYHYIMFINMESFVLLFSLIRSVFVTLLNVLSNPKKITIFWKNLALKRS